jgi:hypothetical protein
VLQASVPDGLRVSLQAWALEPDGLRVSLQAWALEPDGLRISLQAWALEPDGQQALNAARVQDEAPWLRSGARLAQVLVGAQDVLPAQALAASAVPLRPWAASRDALLRAMQGELRGAPDVLPVPQNGPVVLQAVRQVPPGGQWAQLASGVQRAPVRFAVAPRVLRFAAPAARVACLLHTPGLVCSKPARARQHAPWAAGRQQAGLRLERSPIRPDGSQWRWPAR